MKTKENSFPHLNEPVLNLTGDKAYGLKHKITADNKSVPIDTFLM